MGGVVNLLEVGNDAQVYTHAKCLKNIWNLKVLKPEKSIRLDKIESVKVKILYILLPAKNVGLKG